MESNAAPHPVHSSIANAYALISGERWSEAAELLELVLPQAPDWKEGPLLLAQANYHRGRLADAFQGLRSAIGQGATNPGVFLLLGHVLRKAGHFVEAADAYEASLQLNPEQVTALIALGNLARDQRQTRRAREYFDRALRMRPEDPNILNNLAAVLCDVGRTRESIELLEHALRANPAAHETGSNLLLTLHYDSTVPTERLTEAHRSWATQHAAAIARMALTVDRTPGRKLRVGFVSADFKNHPVGRLMEALWPRLDRSGIEVVVYDAGTSADVVTAGLRAQVSAWRPLTGISDDAAATLIQRDRIDILIDLSGHTGGNRLLIFARKPAPIQITWFAYPNTTGLPAMDYRISDELADPAGISDSRYAERLLRFLPIAWQYRPAIADLEPQPLPHTRGRPFTFGCLNNPAKVSEATLNLWAEILRRCPASRLLLLVRDDEESIATLHRRWSEAGLRPDQLVCVHSAPPRQFLAYHYEVDLILDPFPYNGAVTTADALWMGVPVLTLAGDSYVSRQGFAVLSLLGLQEWVAASPEAYVQKAVAAAGRPEELVRLNRELRGLLERSALMDHEGFAREFETRLRAVWSDYRAAPSPAGA
jgi:predicted O-linked N-acetylglucosamine transferase (SPINDLY family)